MPNVVRPTNKNYKTLETSVINNLSFFLSLVYDPISLIPPFYFFHYAQNDLHKPLFVCVCVSELLFVRGCMCICGYVCVWVCVSVGVSLGVCVCICGCACECMGICVTERRLNGYCIHGYCIFF